jgi:DNA-directed RNA polymerase subunit beta'
MRFRVSISSPDRIRARSSGRAVRSGRREGRFTDEAGGLFDPAIFGRAADAVDGDRSGHIELARPCLLPGRLGTLARLLAQDSASVLAEISSDATKFRKRLLELDLVSLEAELVKHLGHARAEKKSHESRLRTVRELLAAKAQPAWLMLEALPVPPIALRPLGSTPDLNVLYADVLDANESNSGVALQRAVDALFEQGWRARGLAVGRYAIASDEENQTVAVVPAPDLEAHRVGMPLSLVRRLLEQEGASSATLSSLVRMQARLRDRVVILSRSEGWAPMGTRAFEPVIESDGRALRLHPGSLSSFGAGASEVGLRVHLPRHERAQADARSKLFATRTLLDVGYGEAACAPTESAALGCYLLTFPRPNPSPPSAFGPPSFASLEDVEAALDHGALRPESPVVLRWRGPVWDLDRSYGARRFLWRVLKTNAATRISSGRLNTFAGRVRFQRALPPDLPFVQGTADHELLKGLTTYVNDTLGPERAWELIESTTALGLDHLTRIGFSLSLDDLVAVPKRAMRERECWVQIENVRDQYMEGLITDGERFNKEVSIWQDYVATMNSREFLSVVAQREIAEGQLNPLLVASAAGAGPTMVELRSIWGAELASKSNGEIIPRPMRNLRDGRTPHDFFDLNHRPKLINENEREKQARKLFKQLRQGLGEVRIVEADCCTLGGHWVEAFQVTTAGEVECLRDRLRGRVLGNDLVDPATGAVLFRAGERLDEERAFSVQEKARAWRAFIRSPLHCQSTNGVCARCYGFNWALGREAQVGDAVGQLAAFALAEPTRRLTERTFHICYCSTDRVGGQLESPVRGRITFVEMKTAPSGVKRDLGHGAALEPVPVVLSRSSSIAILNESGAELARVDVPYGALLDVAEGEVVPAGRRLASWNPDKASVLAEVTGTVHWVGLYEGITLTTSVDEVTGLSVERIRFSPLMDELPALRISPDDGGPMVRLELSDRAVVLVRSGDRVVAGQELARTERLAGSPLTEEHIPNELGALFAARHPEHPAVLANTEGRFEVKMRQVGWYRRKRDLTITDVLDREHRIATIDMSTYVIVSSGERVQVGQPLTSGHVDLQRLLDLVGFSATALQMLQWIQLIYRRSGLLVSDVHVELALRQMLRWYEITEPGDSALKVGQRIDPHKLEDINSQLHAGGKRLPSIKQLIVAIGRAGSDGSKDST